MNAKLEIYFAISQSNYQTVLQNDFITFLRQNFANNKSKLYLFSRNPKAPKLFLLQTLLPGAFQGNTYDISVLCYFPSNFPSIPPEIYLEKIGNIKKSHIFAIKLKRNGKEFSDCRVACKGKNYREIFRKRLSGRV